MRALQSIKKMILDKRYRIRVFDYFGFYKKLSDEKYLKKMFYSHMGKELNLDDPKSYSEKLQWLKLYDRNPLYTKLVDKCEVKKYVADLIGEEYIIPTLGVWDKFTDIDFSMLPNQFVLKCTHDSGGVYICKDKSRFDHEEAKKVIEKSLANNFYLQGREWAYKNVRPRIIAEQYMEDDSTKELRDYKFFCFDGEPKALFIATERMESRTETKFDFFDMEYNHLPFTNGHPNAEILPLKPSQFEKMKELACKLSEGIPHVRVDFYEVNGKVYFGELTFFHWSGFMPFEPEKWDYEFGSWLSLPKTNHKR